MNFLQKDLQALKIEKKFVQGKIVLAIEEHSQKQ